MTDDIYRVKDELQRMVYDHDWGGYDKGVNAERERIINLLQGLIETRPSESSPGWRGYSLERVMELVKGDEDASV
jgi:hypothetical protein